MTLRKLWDLMTGQARLVWPIRGIAASSRLDHLLLDDMGILWCDVAYDWAAAPERH